MGAPDRLKFSTISSKSTPRPRALHHRLANVPELTAIKGHAVVKIPLRADYTPDVKQLVAEAAKAGGGLIHICHTGTFGKGLHLSFGGKP